MPVAQLNLARFARHRDDPANAPFFAAIAAVNAVAEASDGFIWRLVNDDDDAEAARIAREDPQLIVNLSVWRDAAALEAFVYRNADHRGVLARRADWFAAFSPSMVIWPIADGAIPTVLEAQARLHQLAEQGPGQAAFTFAWYRANRHLLEP